MLTAENNQKTQQRRLAWRCRRGMLELDIVLQRFVGAHFKDLTPDELSAFDEMLALPDNEFWVLLSSQQAQSNQKLQAKNAAVLSVINKIRAMQYMAESA